MALPLGAATSTTTSLNGTSTTDEITLDKGTLVINEDGEFTFTPNADVEGIQTFEYTVDDGLGNTDIGEVSIDIDTLIDDGN